MRRSVVAALVAGLVITVLPTADARRPRGKTYRVTATQNITPVTFAWEPADITINVGDSIKWENPTNTEHTMLPWARHGESIPAGWNAEQRVPAGDAVRSRFDEPGLFMYRCELHSDIIYLNDTGNCYGMCGTINVAG